jgi:hypothetical protein
LTHSEAEDAWSSQVPDKQRKRKEKIIGNSLILRQLGNKLSKLRLIEYKNENLHNVMLYRN